MTNITINITTLNLTAGEAAHSHPLPLLIGALIHRAMEEAGNSETGEATTGDADAASASAGASVDVLAFLRQPSDFEYRTADAIRKHFADNEAVAMGVLGNLVAAGHVITKRRRADGVTLYKAAASEATAEVPAETPALTEPNVRSFLGSDSRYTKRTFDAIAKHFGEGCDANYALTNLLERMEYNGDIETSTRRSDGATLYELA